MPYIDAVCVNAAIEINVLDYNITLLYIGLMRNNRSVGGLC